MLLKHAQINKVGIQKPDSFTIWTFWPPVFQDCWFMYHSKSGQGSNMSGFGSPHCNYQFRQCDSERQFCCDVRERVAGRFAGQCRTSWEPGIHLHDVELLWERVQSVLNVALPDNTQMPGNERWFFDEKVNYSGDLNPELVWFLNGQKEVRYQMAWFSNCIWIPDSLSIWILDKWTPSCFLMYWSRIWMVSYIGDSLRPTIWIPNNLKSELQMFTVFKWSLYRYQL